MEWVLANWEYILVAFYALEKIVKLTPTTKDDIIFKPKILSKYKSYKGSATILLTKHSSLYA